MGERVPVTSREVTGFFTLLLAASWSFLSYISALVALDPFPEHRARPATASQAFVAELLPAIVCAATWGVAVWVAGRWWPRLRGRWPLLCAAGIGMAAIVGAAAAVGTYEGHATYAPRLDR